MQDNGIEVIPNVRWNDERTYEFCFDGIEKNKTVAVGTHGCIKRKEDKTFFKIGLAQWCKGYILKTSLFMEVRLTVYSNPIRIWALTS